MEFSRIPHGYHIQCKDCEAEGRTRTFRTWGGYRSHLSDYHKADPKDLVKVSAGAPPDGSPVNN